MSDQDGRPPTSAESAMAANAASRRSQGLQEDRSRRSKRLPSPGGERQSFSQRDDAAKKAAERLRDVNDLLADRTNDA
jgi:hypothetical protein